MATGRAAGRRGRDGLENPGPWDLRDKTGLNSHAHQQAVILDSNGIFKLF